MFFKENPNVLSMDEIRNTLLQYFQGRIDVAAAYLFGSYAENRPRSHSDIDIAVIFSDPKEKRVSRTQRRGQIIEDLVERLLKPVDVVDFDALLPVTAHLMMEHAILVFEADPERRIAAEIRQRRMFRDEEAFQKRRLARLIGEDMP